MLNDGEPHVELVIVMLKEPHVTSSDCNSPSSNSMQHEENVAPKISLDLETQV